MSALKAAPLHCPPLFCASWQRAWAAMGARPPAGLLDTLLASYRQPQRHYHTQEHLQECLEHFGAARALALHPGEVELALWFHDAIYDPKGHDNEMRSADWARRELRAAGADAGVTERVHALVLATRHHAAPTGPDEQLLVDIDLAILGAPPERFAAYDAQVRQEYAWVPGWLYRRKRRAVLHDFLARGALYATDHFRDRLEQQARENLRAALQRL